MNRGDQRPTIPLSIRLEMTREVGQIFPHANKDNILEEMKQICL